MDRYRSVNVTWYDPYSVDAWEEISPSDYKPAIIESFGYEIHRNDERAVIALNIDYGDESTKPKSSCTLIIPEVCIKDYSYIEVDDAKRD